MPQATLGSGQPQPISQPAGHIGLVFDSERRLHEDARHEGASPDAELRRARVQQGAAHDAPHDVPGLAPGHGASKADRVGTAATGCEAARALLADYKGGNCERPASGEVIRYI